MDKAGREKLELRRSRGLVEAVALHLMLEYPIASGDTDERCLLSL